MFNKSRLIKEIISVSEIIQTFVQGEINKVLHESGVEDRHLVARFENNWAGGSRLKE